MKNVDKLHAVVVASAERGLHAGPDRRRQPEPDDRPGRQERPGEGRDLRRAGRPDRAASSSSAPLVAAGMPLLLSIVSIILALALTGLIGQIYPMNTFVLNVLTMMGLAVGIDYTLFVISPLPRGARPRPRQDRRHRRHRRHRQPGHLLQRHDGGSGHARHGHRAARHHHQHGPRRHAGRLHDAAHHPHPAAGPARAAGRPRERPARAGASAAWPWTAPPAARACSSASPTASCAARPSGSRWPSSACSCWPRRCSS